MLNNTLPTVIVPYSLPEDGTPCRDIFVYLRPETNGVLVESSMLRVIHDNSRYRACIELVYLANVPGEFVLANNLIENRYRYKMPFAREGKKRFTDYMKIRFEEYYRCSFSKANILGAYQALGELRMDYDELFGVRVDDTDVLHINCQSIKRIGELFVVNYDLPAILHKHRTGTDIAVMIFRSTLSAEEFRRMIATMGDSLRHNGIIDARTHLTRVFHVSRGPFEQILDAKGHLFASDGKAMDLHNIQFCRFLQNNGMVCHEIEMALHFPIMQFMKSDGAVVEDCLYSYTSGDDYDVAYRKLRSAVSQYIIE